MKNAYDGVYLDAAEDMVSELFEIAFYCDNQDIDYWVNNFFLPRAAKRIEECDPFYLTGRSSLENYMEMMGHHVDADPLPCDTEQYWVGWVLAYSQWYLNRPFSDLLSVYPASKIADMYYLMSGEGEIKTAYILEEMILTKDLKVSNEIELASLKALELYRNNENDYSILFILSRISELKKRLSQKYIEDSKPFPWKKLEMLLETALKGDVKKERISGIINQISESLESLESLRKKYIVGILDAKYGNYPLSYLKEYEDKEKRRKFPKLLKSFKERNS